MKNLKKIALFSFALVLGLLTFVSFSTKANEAGTLECGENPPTVVTVNWGEAPDPAYVFSVCPGESMAQDDIDAFPVVTYPGYTFVQFEGSAGNLADVAALTSNTNWGDTNEYTLTAIWQGNTINLEFVYPTTAPPAGVTATVGQTFDLAPYNTTAQDDATEGQVFTGWTYTLGTDTVTIPANETSFTVPAMEANAKLELTAKYADAVAITFDLNGGTVNGSTDAVVVNVASGQVIPTADIPEVVAPEGQELTGWFDAAEAGTKVDFTIATYEEATTIYAQYQEIPVTPVTVNVTLVLPEDVEWADGYTWTTAQTAGETITLPTAEDVVISTDQVLKGWAVTPDTENTRDVEMYIPGASYEVPTSDVTLTAVIGDEETGGEVIPPAPTPEPGDENEGESTITTVPNTGNNAMFMAIAAAITATSLVAVRKLRA